jgi:DNA-dependent RNA polymerase auxiliary subunit epsilon
MQAGYLIRSIKVEIIENEKTKEKVQIREYVSLPDDRGVSGYRHITEVLTDDDLRLQFIESVKDEFLAIEKKLEFVSSIAYKKAQAVKVEIEKERMKVHNKIKARTATA